jgi:hypothetical protein
MSGEAFRPFGDAIALLGGEDGRHAVAADCFADEVVVDFPSVAPAIERMRTAFLDHEQNVALRTEISLTALEASGGATVPLDVPVRVTCRECGGRGERWTERCAHCDGSGVELLRHQVQVSVPAGVSDGAVFRFTVATRHDPPTRIELLVAVR